jgi:pimeloyl-ACP methyl ester carboxylesterase/DNA-binding CsgD family transcriptional regulator
LLGIFAQGLCLRLDMPMALAVASGLRQVAKMTDANPSPVTAQFVERDQKAEIVDRLYDVAVDPIRLEDLLEVWEGSAAPLRVGSVDTAITLEDPEIEAHLNRASVFLDRLEATRPESSYRAILADIPRSAAFLSDGGAIIAACNRAASLAFGLTEGGLLATLPFDADDIETLRGIVRKVASRRAEKVVILRIRSQTTGSPVIVRITPVDSAAKPPLALILSTELVWPEGFEATVQESFGLTAAEVEIVRGITMGLPLRDIADGRGRSVDTVRTQVRSILAKTETHSQSELVRVVLGLMDVAMIPGDDTAAQTSSGGLAPIPFQHIIGGDGRRLEWLTFGAPHGRPLLFMHLDYGLVRWPAKAERAAVKRGLRVIVPVRAGYGRSDLHPKGVDYIPAVMADYAAVMDHLGIKDAVVVPMGADLRFALALAAARPDLVRAIVGAACQLPVRTAAQYERMDKWQRFILANARYAPKVLPFLVKAGFSLARRLGKASFFTQVNGGSPADMTAFALPDVRAAVLEGSETCMSARHLAAEAFTRECISSEKDWSALVRAARVPVTLFQGDQDPQTPVLTIQELMVDYPHLTIEFLPDTGQLLFFTAWPRVLDAVDAAMLAEKV